MVRLLLLLLVAIGFIGCQDGSSQKPMLWEIQTSPPSYLFGTYHTKDPAFIPPKIVFDKLKKSQRLYTEIILSQEAYDQINAFATLSPPVPLDKRVSNATIRKIKNYLQDINSSLRIEDFSNLHLWAVGIVLSNEPENIIFGNRDFMDEQLVNYAKKNKIQTKGLEEWREQLEFLSTLLIAQQEDLLRYIIDSLSHKEAIQEWYSAGEPDGFVELEKKVSQEYYHLMEPMRLARNETMARRIDILLQSKPKMGYFFAIGAGHLGQSDGVIEKLEQKGYKLKKLQ